MADKGTGKAGARGTDAPDKAGKEAAAAPKPSKRERRRASATEHSALGERLIAGVPARIMRPRLVFLSCLIAILAFGLLMVYSASSVEALKEQGSSTYFLFRQAIFIGFGALAFAAICWRGFLPWAFLRSGAIWTAWVGIVALLLIVLAIGAGSETWGATRWIPLGFFNLQPSEFAKPVVVLAAGKVMADYYDEDGTLDTPTFLFMLGACVGIPLLLIFIQPDLGTTIIIGAAVLAMGYLAGISYKLLGMIGIVIAIAGAAAIAAAPYRLTRFLASLDPWSDPYDTGYQATLAIMAFASGGLLGRGIGNATMKYNYLPEAHNDYILAIIGEELGFVGTVVFVIVFLVMIAAAFTIARRSPTLHGQLVAGGCAFILIAQFFINALGILGVTPMTGKPLPFVSYGGSAIVSAMALAGIICRVSLESNVATEHDARRAGFSVMDEQDAVSDHIGRSTAGAVRVRRGSGAATAVDASPNARTSRPRPRFSVYDGGAPVEPRDTLRDRPSGGYERINLSGGESDRLRTGGARPRVDYRDVTGARVRRSGDNRATGRGRASTDRDSRYGRGRYDR